MEVATKEKTIPSPMPICATYINLRIENYKLQNKEKKQFCVWL